MTAMTSKPPSHDFWRGSQAQPPWPRDPTKYINDVLTDLSIPAVEVSVRHRTAVNDWLYTVLMPDGRMIEVCLTPAHVRAGTGGAEIYESLKREHAKWMRAIDWHGRLLPYEGGGPRPLEVSADSNGRRSVLLNLFHQPAPRPAPNGMKQMLEEAEYLLTVNRLMDLVVLLRDIATLAESEVGVQPMNNTPSGYKK